MSDTANDERERVAGQAARVSVLLPRALLDLFPDAVREVGVSAATVGEMIAALDGRWPGMRDRLCDSTPRVRRHINIFIDGRRASLETPLRDGARVYVLTAISGG
jgi:molybdopterin synthase sulfur carrier subunit